MELPYLGNTPHKMHHIYTGYLGSCNCHYNIPASAG